MSAGRTRHFYLRKKQIRAYAKEVLERGEVEQVVVLGAGFDVLALELGGAFPDVNFIEIDLPASQRFKRQAFADSDVALPDNVEFIEGDLRESLTGILDQSMSHQPSKTTLWIAEGLLMFLPEDAVKGMFQSILEVSEAGSRMIFTTISSEVSLSSLNFVTRFFFSMRNKYSFLWAVSFEDVSALMEMMGFSVVWQIRSNELHHDYIDGGVIAEDMHVVAV